MTTFIHIIIITPTKTIGGGYIGITLSIRPSVYVL